MGSVYSWRGLVYGVACLHSKIKMLQRPDPMQNFENFATQFDSNIPSANVNITSSFEHNTYLNVSKALAFRRVKSSSVFINLPQLTLYKY